MTPGPWAALVTPTAARVRCRNAIHTVRWVAGALQFESHDMDSELVLRALGGPSCGCVEVAEAWLQPVGPADVYALWNASSEWPTAAASDRGITASDRGITMVGLRLDERLRAERSHATWAGLPVQFRRRRALESCAILPASGDPLRQVLASVASPLLRRLVPAVACEALASGAVDIRVTLTDGPAVLRGEAASWGGWVRAELPPRWLPEVWATEPSHSEDSFPLEASGRCARFCLAAKSGRFQVVVSLS